jgi:hypothetical protein
MAKAAEAARGWGLGVEVDAYFARKVEGRVRFERVDV